MSLPQLPNLTEESPAIRVAIVCGPETTVLADSLEALLAEAEEFTFSRFEYRAETKGDLKPHTAGFGNPDVVVAALGSFQAANLELFFALAHENHSRIPLKLYFLKRLSSV